MIRVYDVEFKKKKDPIVSIAAFFTLAEAKSYHQRLSDKHAKREVEYILIGHIDIYETAQEAISAANPIKEMIIDGVKCKHGTYEVTQVGDQNTLTVLTRVSDKKEILAAPIKKISKKEFKLMYPDVED